MERTGTEHGQSWAVVAREADLEARLDGEDALWGDRELAALRDDLALLPADALRHAS